MALPKLPFQVSTSSRQLLSGNHQNNVNNLLTSFAQVTALAGGGLSTLTPVINNAFTEANVVVNDNDSVVLPVAKVGLRCYISNSTVKSLQVFANGTDTINGTAGNVGVALVGGATALYVCTKDGVWRRFVSA